MAASVPTTATTLEGQALEIATALQIAEKAENLDNVSIQTDIEDGQTIITIVLPTTFSGSGGAYSMTATEYLP